jgi:hypothetical protein
VNLAFGRALFLGLGKRGLHGLVGREGGWSEVRWLIGKKGGRLIGRGDLWVEGLVIGGRG